MNLSLVYLSYIPFGKSYLEEFLNSYKEHDAGLVHDLVIVFNGHESPEEMLPFLNTLNDSGVIYKHLISPEKFDIGSYFYAASELKSEFIAFVNTYSRVLQPRWLLYLYQNVTKKDVGFVSATASWGDFPHNDEYKKLLGELYRLRSDMTSLKKIIFFRFNFYPYVKPHLRTNAFMIKRTLFIGLKFDMVKPTFLNFFFNYSGTKLKSLCFEHGNNGFTNQIIKMGLKPLLVNKYGNGYEMEEWNKAGTFWISDQENLLVSDNQTMKYELASKNEKNLLNYAAWGPSR